MAEYDDYGRPCPCDCGCVGKKDCPLEVEHTDNCRECHCYQDDCSCVTEEIEEEEA